MLPKIHKRLYDIPGRPVISNCGFFIENISAFPDHQLKPITMQVNSYITDTNDFLKKLRDLPDLPEDSIICTIDVVGLYPSIPNEEGLSFLRNALDKRSNKNLTTDTLIELAELVLQNIISNLMNDTLNKYDVRSAICHYLYGSARGRFSRNTYEKALAVVEVY